MDCFDLGVATPSSWGPFSSCLIALPVSCPPSGTAGCGPDRLILLPLCSGPFCDRPQALSPRLFPVCGSFLFGFPSPPRLVLLLTVPWLLTAGGSFWPACGVDRLCAGCFPREESVPGCRPSGVCAGLCVCVCHLWALVSGLFLREGVVWSCSSVVSGAGPPWSAAGSLLPLSSTSSLVCGM